MKRFAIVLTALALAAGAAQAAGFDQPHNSPVRPFTAEQTSQVRADEVLSPRELSQRDIAPNAVIEVTSFPSSDRVDPPSRND